MKTLVCCVCLVLFGSVGFSPLSAGEDTDSVLKTFQLNERRFVSGRVLTDRDSLPVTGATVQLQTPLEAKTVTTNPDGIFEAYINGSPIEITTAVTSHVTQRRQLSGKRPAERLPDLRLTPRQAAAGSPFVTDAMTVTLAGGLAGPASMTPFSDQALTTLLPLGFTPAAGFELDGAAGTGSLLWQVNSRFQVPANSPWLFLRQEGLGWRVSAILAGDTPLQATYTDAADGAYLLALQDPGATAPTAVVGDLLTRTGDQLVSRAALDSALALPPHVSITEEPITDFLLTLSAGPTPSGSRALVELYETHRHMDGSTQYQPDRLDLYCYYSGAQNNGKLQGRLSVKNRIAIDQNLTQSAQMRFESAAVTRAYLDFPSDKGDFQVGPVTMDFSAVMSEPLVMRLNSLWEHQLPGLEHGAFQAAFSMLLGGDLAGQPTLRLSADGDHAAMIVLRRFGGSNWLYAGQLQFNGQDWVSDPNRSDLAVDGVYAVMALDAPITEIEGRIYDGGQTVAAVSISGETHPWHALSGADGFYRFFIPRDTATVIALNLENRRTNGLTLSAEPGDSLLTGRDIHLADPVFQLVSYLPLDGEMHLPLLPEIQLTFDLPVSFDEIAVANAMTLSSSAGEASLRVTVNGNQVYVLPNQSLLADTTYTFQVDQSLTNIYGSNLSQAAAFTFHTLTPSDTTLDLTRFYLSYEEDQLYLNAPAQEVPARTYLDVLNTSTATANSWLTQADVDFRQALEGVPGDLISIRATTPNGRQFQHMVSVVKVDAATWRMGTSPFTVELEDNLLFRVDEVKSGVGSLVKIEAVGVQAGVDQVAQTEALDGATDLQVHRVIRIQALDGAPMPSLRGRIQAQIESSADRILNLFQITREPVTDLADGETRMVNLPSLEDTLVLSDPQINKRRYGLFMAMAFETRDMMMNDPSWLVVASNVTGNEMTKTSVNASRREHPDIKVPNINRQNSILWWYMSSMDIDPNWAPAANVSLFLNHRYGAGLPMGNTDMYGERLKFVCFCVPTTVSGLDPLTGEIQKSKVIQAGTVSSMNGVSTQKSMLQHVHFSSQFPGEAEPFNLEMIWRLETFEDNGWVKDAQGTADLREHKVIKAGDGKRLYVRLVLGVNHHIDAANITVPGIDFVLEESSPHAAELSFDPNLCLTTGMLELEIQIPSRGSVSSWFKVYTSDLDESLPGPPRIIEDNLHDEFGVSDNIYLEASESVTGWHDNVTLSGPSGIIDVTLLDTSFNILAQGESARTVHVLPKSALQYDQEYTLVVKDVEDLDGEALDMRGAASTGGQPEFRKAFYTQAIPERINVTDGDKKLAHAVHNNLMVVMRYEDLRFEKEMTLQVYDIRKPKTPKALRLSGKMGLPYKRVHHLALFTPEMLNGRMLIDDRQPLDDLPLHTVLLDMGLAWNDGSQVAIWFYLGQGQWSSLGNFAFSQGRFPQHITTMGNYLAVSFVDLDNEVGSGVTVVDMKFLIRHLLMAENAQRAVNASERPAPDVLSSDDPEADSLFEMDTNWNQLRFKNMINELRGMFPRKFTYFPMPYNNRETAFALTGQGKEITPSLMMAGYNFPGMLNFTPGSLVDTITIGDTATSFLDGRLKAKTAWHAGPSGRTHVQVLEDFQFTNPSQGPEEPSVLVRDLAVFAQHHKVQGVSYIQIYDIPDDQIDLNLDYRPRLVLEVPDKLYDMALSKSGVLSLVTQNKELYLLDLQVQLSKYEPGLGPHLLDEDSDYLNRSTLNSDIFEMTQHNGLLITLGQGRTALGYHPVDPIIWREQGWEWYDMSDWRDADTDDPPSLELSYSPNIVFYASDKIVDAENPKSRFLMEMGSFALKAYQDEAVKWWLEDADGNSLQEAFTRDKAADDIIHSFSSVHLREYFKKPEKQQKLRQQGYLSFNVVYEIRLEDTLVERERLPFVVAYRYDETRYLDPFRNLPGLDALSCQPVHQRWDHWVTHADNRLNLSSGRVINSDFTFEASVFGMGVADTQVAVASLLQWWDIGEMNNAYHTDTHLHPRFVIEKPAHWRYETQISEEGETAVVINDPLTTFTKTDAGWLLNDRKSIHTQTAVNRNLPDAPQWFKHLNIALEGDGSAAEKMRYPLMRYGVESNAPPNLSGPLRISRQTGVPFANQMLFETRGAAAAFPTQITEEIAGDSGKRHLKREYFQLGSDYLINNISYPHDDMQLAYEYDEDSYLTSVTQKGLRKLTYTWEPVAGLTLGDRVVKRLKSVSNNDETIKTQYLYPNERSLIVSGIHTVASQHNVTAEPSETGLPAAVTFTFTGGVPSLTRGFQRVDGADLTTSFSPGNHNLTWQRMTVDDVSIPLLSADSFQSTRLVYDPTNFLLLEHHRLDGSEKWEYNNTGGLIETPTAYINPIGTRYEIETNGDTLTQTITAQDGPAQDDSGQGDSGPSGMPQAKTAQDNPSIEVRLAPSGVAIGSIGLDQHEVGGQDSEFYLPTGPGFQEKSGRITRTPVPGKPDVPAATVEYNAFGEPTAVTQMGVAIDIEDYDELGRPRKITTMNHRKAVLTYTSNPAAGRRTVTAVIETAGGTGAGGAESGGTESGGDSEKTASKETHIYEYDPFDRLVTHTFSRMGPAVTIRYEYDELSRLTKVTRDGRAKELYSATYEGELTHPTNVTQPDGSKIDFTLSQQFTTLIKGASYTIDDLTSVPLPIETNGLGRLIKAQISGRGIATLSYDAFGRKTQINPENGKAVDISYAGGLTTINDKEYGVTTTIRKNDPAGLSVDLTRRLDEGLGGDLDQSIRTDIQGLSGGRGLHFSQSITGGPEDITLDFSNTGNFYGGSAGALSFKADMDQLNASGKALQFNLNGEKNLTLTYHAFDQLATLTDASQQTHSFAYDHLGRHTETTTPRGLTQKFSYFDDENTLNSISMVDGEDTDVIYAAGNHTSHTVTSYFGGNTKTTTKALGQTYEIDQAPNSGGNSEDGSGDDGEGSSGDGGPVAKRRQSTSAFEINRNTGQPVKFTNPSGDVTTWLDEGDAITTQFPKGSQTTIYDGLGRVIATLTSDGATYETTYDDHGRIASLISPQRTLEFHYQGRYLSTVTGGAEDITIAQRDAVGRILLMHYGERLTIEQTYHANGQLASLTQTPKGGLWKQFEYDKQGGLIGIYRQNQPDLTYTLNAWGAPETMHYDGEDTTLLDGDRHTLNLPAGAVLILDDQGRRKTLQRPGLADVETERDGMGRPTATLVGSQVQATHTYTDNLLSQVGIRDDDYPDVRTLTYNDNAQLTQISNSRDGNTQFDYEVSGPAVGKVKTHTDPNNTSYQYSYDARGRVTGLSISNGPSFSYAYDAGDNLTMVESGGLSTSWSGYGEGLPAQMQWSSMAQPLAITKNQQGRLTGVSGGGFNLGLDWSGGDNVHISGVVRNTATQTESWAPAYDATNRRLMEVAITREVNEVDQNIIEIYGSDNQLKTGLVRRINGATVLNQAQSLDIDADRRRVSTMYSTNSAASTAEYDDVGNLISLKYGNGASQAFRYDGERRVREIITKGDGATRRETYYYDHQKRRIRTVRSDSDISTVYAWQGSRVIAVGKKTGDIVTWTHAIGHGPLGPTFIKDLGTSGNDYHIMTDHLGTPYAYRHAGTGTVYHTPYNPWGEPMHIPAGVEPPYRSSGELPADNGTSPPAEVFEAVPLGLGGHFYDIGTGLVYMHNRYYHPRLGHFLTPDFRAPDIYDPSTFTEPYAYAAGNPVMFWDPDGLKTAVSLLMDEAVRLEIEGKHVRAIGVFALAVLEETFAGAVSKVADHHITGDTLISGGDYFWAATEVIPVDKVAKLFRLGELVKYSPRLEHLIGSIKSSDHYRGVVAKVQLAGEKNINDFVFENFPLNDIFKKVSVAMEQGVPRLGRELSDDVVDVYGSDFFKLEMFDDVWVSKRPVDGEEVANLAKHIAQQDGRVVDILSGTHGQPGGRRIPERWFFDEDIPLVDQGFANSVSDVTGMTFGEISSVIKSKNPTICAWCYSERSILVRQIFGTQAKHPWGMFSRYFTKFVGVQTEAYNPAFQSNIVNPNSQGGNDVYPRP